MITKPEDARPRVMIDYPKYPHFTAAECAEIARAYGYAVANSFIDTEDEKVRKFEALFAEWEKTK